MSPLRTWTREETGGGGVLTLSPRVTESPVKRKADLPEPTLFYCTRFSLRWGRAYRSGGGCHRCPLSQVAVPGWVPWRVLAKEPPQREPEPPDRDAAGSWRCCLAPVHPGPPVSDTTGAYPGPGVPAPLVAALSRVPRGSACRRGRLPRKQAPRGAAAGAET